MKRLSPIYGLRPQFRKKKVQADQTLLYVSRESYIRKMLKSHSICLVLDFQGKYNCQFDKFPKRPFTVAQWACHFMRRTCPLESSRFQRSYGQRGASSELSLEQSKYLSDCKSSRISESWCTAFFFFKRYWPLTETPPGSSRTETPSG